MKVRRCKHTREKEAGASGAHLDGVRVEGQEGEVARVGAVCQPGRKRAHAGKGEGEGEGVRPWAGLGSGTREREREPRRRSGWIT